MQQLPIILQDRISLAALEARDPALVAALAGSLLGIKEQRASVFFCGMAWVSPQATYMFLPRQTLLPNLDGNPQTAAANLHTARLTMRTLSRYLRDKSQRKGVAAELVGSSGLLPIISSLADDFIRHGIYRERERRLGRNSGKPLWPQTLAREVGLLDAHDNLVFPNILTSRSLDTHQSLLARIQAAVMLEISVQHGWWIAGLESREGELKRYDPPTLPREQWATHLLLLLQNLYASREIHLVQALLAYLQNDKQQSSGATVFGMEDFQFVWEHMLREVLLGVEPDWNSKLPRPAYERADGTVDFLSHGFRTDIVLHDGQGLQLVDAKYYDATGVNTVPGLADVTKQFFYDLALQSVAWGRSVSGSFVFPALHTGQGPYVGVAMRHVASTEFALEGEPVAAFPRINCHYLSVRQVMQAYLEGRRIALPEAANEVAGGTKTAELRL